MDTSREWKRKIEVSEMKILRTVMATTLFAVLILAVALPVSAKPGGAIKCEIPIEFNFHDGSTFPYWKGEISGCDLEGMTIKFFHDADYPQPNFDNPASPPPPVLVGNTYHFYELFTIYDLDGEPILYGKDVGVLTFSNWKFRANGVVTAASPEWEHLIGSRYYERGTVDPPGLAIPTFALDTTMMITP